MTQPRTLEATEPSASLPYPNLMKQGPWNRKAGSHDYERFDHRCAGSYSAGGANLGDVKIDCKFLFRKSKWGTISHRKIAAGVIYMDLVFQQKPDCKITSATVTVTLRDRKEAKPAAFPSQMTDFYGPKSLVGSQRAEQKQIHTSLQPNISVMGNTVSGMGKSFETSFQLCHRWNFHGSMSADDSGIYRSIGWDLSENKLESGQNGTVHTAFTVTHGGQGFLMDVKIQGKLERMGDRLRQIGRKLKFRPDGRRPGQISTTLIGAYKGEKPGLDMLAAGLEQAMVLENSIKRPVELPDPQQAVFRELRPEIPSFLSQASEVSCRSPAQPGHMGLEINDHIELRNRLLSSAESLMRPQVDLVRESLWENPEASIPSTEPARSRRSSSPTLVDEQQQEASIESVKMDPGSGIEKPKPENHGQQVASARDLLVWVYLFYHFIFHAFGLD
ncbi:hypothetical protein RB595_004329 [Gaeumannomyces hyphopodioides]